MNLTHMFFKVQNLIFFKIDIKRLFTKICVLEYANRIFFINLLQNIICSKSNPIKPFVTRLHQIVRRMYWDRTEGQRTKNIAVCIGTMETAMKIRQAVICRVHTY